MHLMGRRTVGAWKKKGLFTMSTNAKNAANIHEAKTLEEMPISSDGSGAAVTVLGARGTAAVFGSRVLRYGGGTSCLLVRMAGETIVLDAGTGIQRLECALKDQEKRIWMLLSHAHFDHIEGLLSCEVLYDDEKQIQIYGAELDGLSVEEQIRKLMSPPLWPVGPEAFSAAVTFHETEECFQLGQVTVRTMGGIHPGGSVVYRLEHEDVSIVYATDYEIDENSIQRIEEFSRGCTLLLCDGHYFQEEREKHRGYGHSCWNEAVQLAKRCGAEKLRIIHHAPWRGDDALDQADLELKKIFRNGAFAKGGEEIRI